VHPVTLVLGPGQARGYAHAGVLRALQENKIPIGAIYGAEMGALLGALYAKDANINHFEWSLQNFGEDTLAPHASLMDRLIGKNDQNSPLSEKLKIELGSADLSSFKIPLQVVSFLEPPVVSASGPAASLILDSLRPHTLSPTMIAESEQLMCQEARARYGAPVILVEVSGSSSDPSAADLVIRPELGDLSPLDYSKATDIAFRGKTALEARVADIERAVNLPPRDPNAP
jgi:predicted acylesterase/phospholipase RssA